MQTPRKKTWILYMNTAALQAASHVTLMHIEYSFRPTTNRSTGTEDLP